MGFEDFTFILAYPILFTGTKALQSRKTKELRQFEKAFSLKTEGWSVSRLRRKILLECLKKLGLLRLAEKAFQWDQHTQRALLYNHFPPSAESGHWSKNLVGFMSAVRYMVSQAPAGKDGGFLSSSGLEKEQEQPVPSQWVELGLFPSPRQKVTWVVAEEKPWSEAARWKGAAGPATGPSITSFLTPQSKASCPLSQHF